MSSDLSSPVPSVNKEAVKVLAKAVGIREAARQMGLDEYRVLKWSQRDPAGPWGVATVTVPLCNVGRPAKALSSNVLTASSALDNVLSDRHKKTKLGLSKYVRDGAHNAARSKGDLSLAADVKALAGVAAFVWPEAKDGGALRINVYADLRPQAAAEQPVIDV